jgi:ribonuclease HI
LSRDAAKGSGSHHHDGSVSAVMHFDGSSRQGHGGAAAVYHIKGLPAQSEVDVKKSWTSPPGSATTSTKQESLAAVRGMQSLRGKVAACGIKPSDVKVTVRGDSKQTIDAMDHVHVPKDPTLQRLQSRGERLASGFKGVTWEKVDRKENSVAHHLASAASKHSDPNSDSHASAML